MKVYKYNGDPRNLTMPIVALCAWYKIDKNGAEVFCQNYRKLGYGFCKHHLKLDDKRRIKRGEK